MASTLDGLHYKLVSHLLRSEEIQWIGDHKELGVVDTWRGQSRAKALTAEYARYCRIATLNGRKVVTTSTDIGRPIYGYTKKEPHEAILGKGICTHDEIRQVLRDALRDKELRKAVADYLRGTTRAVIVDEVFDGNGLDLEIVKVAAEASIPITLIGDPWQALYEFRGAEPDLVRGLIAELAFEKFSVDESFRFKTDEMKGLADQLRRGEGVRLSTGLPEEADVVLAAKWSALWKISDDVLPLAFGQIDTLTDAAMALLLKPLVLSRFSSLAHAPLEAAVALGLSPDADRNDLRDALIPVLDQVMGGTREDAAAALRLLRETFREIAGRNIPALSAREEAKRVGLLVALSSRLRRTNLIPGMTVHQAKGLEWNRVAVYLTPRQQERVAAGLSRDDEGDRKIYVSLTRAKERVYRL